MFLHYYKNGDIIHDEILTVEEIHSWLQVVFPFLKDFLACWNDMFFCALPATETFSPVCKSYMNLYKLIEDNGRNWPAGSHWVGDDVGAHSGRLSNPKLNVNWALVLSGWNNADNQAELSSNDVRIKGTLKNIGPELIWETWTVQ